MQTNSDAQSRDNTADSVGNAAQQGAKTARQVGKAAKKAAAKGAEQATKTAAGAAVNAGVKTGKAVASVAKGAAAGGPWGAIAGAAWAFKDTLLKIVVSVSMAVIFFVVAIISLPSAIINNITEKTGISDFIESYNDLKSGVLEVIETGYKYSLGYVVDLITDGGYNYDRSMDATQDNSNHTSGFDPAYIIAAYSVSMMQENADKQDMLDKLGAVSMLMFPVTHVVHEVEEFFEDPLGYIVSLFTRYVECIIHPFDNSVILLAFGIDKNEQYSDFNITVGEAIDNMTEAIHLSIGG